MSYDDTVSLEFIGKRLEILQRDLQDVRAEQREIRQRHSQTLQGLETLHREIRQIPDGIEIGINARLSVIEEKIDNLGRSLVLELRSLLDERFGGATPKP